MTELNLNTNISDLLSPVIRIEAEDMLLSGYRTESSPTFSFASNKAYTSLFAQEGGETGTASTVFSGASGNYKVTVGYFDESDGISNFRLNINNREIDRWDADNLNGGIPPSSQSFTTKAFYNVSVASGDTIELIGLEDGDEAARIDYIEFVPTGTVTPSVDAIGGSNGIIEIMPMGDSITRGEDPTVERSVQNGYRDDLGELLQRAQIAFDYVGSQNNGEGFDTNHEGHGGWRIDRLISNVNRWLDTDMPEIVLLKIGTNDMGFSSISVEDATARLSTLITTITTRLPSTQVIVSSIAAVNPANFTNSNIVPGFETRVAQFNGMIPDLVDDLIATGKNVSFADVFSAMAPTEHLSSDGFHPNESGYEVIADVLSTAVQTILADQSARPQPVISTFDVTNDHLLGGQADIAFTLENKGNASLETLALQVIYSDDDIIGNSDDWQVSTYRISDLLIGESVSNQLSVDLPLDILNQRSQSEDASNLGVSYVSNNIDYIALRTIDGTLLAVDDVTYFPWDIDSNGTVTATDAIYTINRLGQSVTANNQLADFDGNGQITPTDAIASINRLGYSINPTVFEPNTVI